MGTPQPQNPRYFTAVEFNDPRPALTGNGEPEKILGLIDLMRSKSYAGMEGHLPKPSLITEPAKTIDMIQIDRIFS